MSAEERGRKDYGGLWNGGGGNGIVTAAKDIPFVFPATAPDQVLNTVRGGGVEAGEERAARGYGRREGRKENRLETVDVSFDEEMLLQREREGKEGRGGGGGGGGEGGEGASEEGRDAMESREGREVIEIAGGESDEVSGCSMSPLTLYNSLSLGRGLSQNVTGGERDTEL